MKESRNHKYVSLLERNERKVVVEVENYSLDVPYAESFRVVEKWTGLSSSKDSNKCILR